MNGLGNQIGEYVMISKELELSLFEKIEGNYVPTSAGKLYLQFAKDVLTRKVQFDSDFRELLQYRQGRLRFGLTPGRSKSLTPDVLPKIRKHFPDIKIESCSKGGLQWGFGFLC